MRLQQTKRGLAMVTRHGNTAASAALDNATGSFAATQASDAAVVNDIHSQLNPTRVDRVLTPENLSEVQAVIHRARAEGKSASIAGGRHAMGGQQFGDGTLLVDMRKMNRVLHFDLDRGIIEVEAGAFWPELMAEYLHRQRNRRQQWGLAQKQTGADRLSIGGTLAANAHGRGLTLKPFIADVEAFTLVNAAGVAVRCSREENPLLFRLAVGGYGLFGIVCSVSLRLTPRLKMERIVEIRNADGLMEAFDDRVQNGFRYGDFQFAIDPGSGDFLHKGVFSCYRPLHEAEAEDTGMPENTRELSDDAWRTLLHLAHADKTEAFQQYADHYLSTNGQRYWSDTHQSSFYPEHYHQAIDRAACSQHAATEIITEINVPRECLSNFLAEAREDFRRNHVDLIYGTVRLIEKDEESFLPWARESYACTIFNLHTVHTPEGLEHSASAFRRLIDMAVRRGGTYYLTYHRYARRDQVLDCYPTFPAFLRLKRQYDPGELFQSTWYRHYVDMFKDSL
jgi:FAD/FMN-containing dehydrogenase